MYSSLLFQFKEKQHKKPEKILRPKAFMTEIDFFSQKSITAVIVKLNQIFYY